ncbi:hypothetical protein N9528_01150 [Crocinitomicaceae bacterium]|nr:hypothetical protein [Crocinitomicaceae bacterium]
MKKNNKTNIITVRVTDNAKKSLKKEAEKMGVNLSTLISSCLPINEL